MSTPAAPLLNDTNIETIINTLVGHRAAHYAKIAECEKALATLYKIRRQGKPLANPP